MAFNQESQSHAQPNGQQEASDSVEIHELTTPNEGNGDSVTVPAGPDQHTDVENPDNSVVEEDPTNGDLAARVKFGSKIGIFAAGTSVAWTIAIFNNSGSVDH